MYSTEEYDLEEENSDPDKKHFVVEQRYAQNEKKVIWAIFILGLLVWFFCIQEKMILSYKDYKP
jgi:hypothetical protein